ncbi:MAG: Asp23/Gls24 family envelope stress response protein [Ruminococcus sp.]|jgi:uncharacterized alkaline shock family protein YloU|nr:Asp23/Gls24 family envelope stress response protein [Ruminococcus sp.]
MLITENYLGTIEYSERFLTTLISDAAQECFGVAGICEVGAMKQLKNLFMLGKYTKKGIYIKALGNELIVEVHIAVLMGTNISATCDSLSERISFVITDATNLPVNSVEVCVDEVLL